MSSGWHSRRGIMTAAFLLPLVFLCVAAKRAALYMLDKRLPLLRRADRTPHALHECSRLLEGARPVAAWTKSRMS